MKQIDLERDEYQDVGVEIGERFEAMMGAKPPELIPPPCPPMPDIKWVTPKIVDGVAIYEPSDTK